MKSEDIIELFKRFEQEATRINDVECWSARGLCPLLGYADWRNFLKAIEKAKESCINAGEKESDHFVDANKMISLAFCWNINKEKGENNMYTFAPVKFKSEEERLAAKRRMVGMRKEFEARVREIMENAKRSSEAQSCNCSIP